MSNGDATQGDAMTPQEFAKLMGAYPQPAENPLPAYGGYMDNSAANFSWVQNNDYFGAENDDQIKLFYEGIYTNDDEDDEREGQEIMSHSLVSKKDYQNYYEDTKWNPCACDEQGCLSCFLEEYPHTPAIKEGGIESYGSLWFEDEEWLKSAETFEAPYGGAGSLMDIGKATPLADFTGQELAESSAIHGDFDQASLNYSGHQNLEVRAEGRTSSGQTYYETGEKVGMYGGNASSGEIAFYQGLPELKRTLSTLSSLDDTNRGIVLDFVKEWKGGSTRNLWAACQQLWEGAKGKEHYTDDRPYWKRAEMEEELYDCFSCGEPSVVSLGLGHCLDCGQQYDAEDEELNYPCGACGKPSDYNFQDATVRWNIVDDDFETMERPMISDYGGDGQNDFYCKGCASKYEGSKFYAEFEDLTGNITEVKNIMDESVARITIQDTPYADDDNVVTDDVDILITDMDGNTIIDQTLDDSWQPPYDDADDYLAENAIVKEVKKVGLPALALGMVGGVLMFMNKDKIISKGKEIFNSDTQEVLENDPELVENPNTGDLDPAQYEEMVVESTGYAVDVIPKVLDGSFMGSRFAALPTERYVEYSDPGIGAHTDIALNRDEIYLEPEMAVVQASENVVKESQAPGQSPYNSVTGEENPDFDYRVLKETTVVSLDPAVKPFIPQSMAGYTGNANTPPSVYNKMFNIGVLGQTPAFVAGGGDMGASHTGSRNATPNTLGLGGSVGGPLSDQVNANYTDGTTSMSLAQWAIENTVSQTSDTEAVVIDRSSGQMKRVRRV